MVTLAVPRLHFLEEIGAMPERKWTELRQFIHRISKDPKHSITFSKKRSLPCDLSSRPPSDVSVVSSLDGQTIFKEFLDMFPQDVKHLLQQGCCDSRSSVVYRVFEVYTLSTVAKELSKCLDGTQQSI